ncbi:hypothetical protein C2G38_2247731 [Gigaspora rosea]|uniref:DNA-directed DNA polymerase family B exonuclease domain-containing protein n=1 Tax=Gigaspora rosea TaxID=44941 RepID=A0A397V2P0_9GLOM|nr:hypothetical protein C2G38_2247731 [Gigaspora rosea]
MSKQSAQQMRYGGGETLAGIPSRSDIISECDNGLTAILQQSLSEKKPIHFMPNDVEDAFEYVNNVQTYILHIYGPLINGQKARVDITGIKPFFDVIVPDNEPLSIFKPRLVKIILGAEKIDKSKFGMKVVHAYPIRGYHTQEKSLEENKPDDQVITEALSHDRTLVLTWDIETYSARKMGDLPNAKNDKDQVFMICMTVHWKDNSKPLKRICLVDVETKPDPSWITIKKLKV